MILLKFKICSTRTTTIGIYNMGYGGAKQTGIDQEEFRRDHPGEQETEEEEEDDEDEEIPGMPGHGITGSSC